MANLRTMLQPLDSVRYKTPDLFNREVDTAHARTEVLLAILFGFDIVIGANDVADSRGFMRIFAEFNEQGGRRLGDYRRRTFHSYRPFKAGLRTAFEDDGAGNRGYDAYVADVAAKLGVRRGDGYINFRNSLDVLKEGIRWYQNACDGETSLRGGELDETREHIRRAYEYFSPRTGREDDAVYAGMSIAQNDANLFGTAIRTSCARVARRTPALASKAADTARSLEEVLCQGCRLANRDDWYAVGADFENWPVVRSWLDIALHRKLSVGFGVFLPSYFTQDLQASGDDPDLFYGILDDRSHAAVRARSPDEDGLMLPGVHEVDWDQILDLALSREHQDKVGELRDIVELIDRSARDEHKKLVKADPPADGSSHDDVRANRRRRVAEALAAHADYLNGQSAGVAIVTRGTKIIRQDDGSKIAIPRIRATIAERASEEAKLRLDRKLEVGSELSLFGLAKLLAHPHSGRIRLARRRSDRTEAPAGSRHIGRGDLAPAAHGQRAGEGGGADRQAVGSRQHIDRLGFHFHRSQRWLLPTGGHRSTIATSVRS